MSTAQALAPGANNASDLPASPIPIFTTVASFREWRRKAFDEKKTVGFVPTMGALHDGHLSLVKHSLASNDLTVVSIFVNPTQFAPNEDLATYPRTLSLDLELLSAMSYTPDSSSSSSNPSPSGVVRTPSAVFLPSVQEMYPSGVSQSVDAQKGTFVEVKGYGEQMEGKSRPTFFRGVATVVTKLFNAIEPTNAYFGQKDIQQGLLLRRMVRDTLLSHPDPEHLHIMPTARDPTDGLALSSRNVYLTLAERQFAPTLYAALQAARDAWTSGWTKDESVSAAIQLVNNRAQQIVSEVEVKVDYIDMNDAETFEVVHGATTAQSVAGRPVILSGAVWVGRTRLIDNLILGDEAAILG
ncbi:Pantoate-beta-alanine ligase [Gloeophyllum trabeum ATCC 11539]|uniref:Pantoate--beta-alanine ligase n=1 Tax=Gloeophyllum trabeum (strain ATCC 11539 / FP-39264 / Madison 617) TaxID=670483 RepID=S7QA73_GLOTA|nr:Pantoate-beta-alanine ligase [Gloeophyllum trabeum ATCC 11539]EPQ56273.1 Pantoate-beta-alanine ligase [Gloeophyllum trabeum ATCC 11539]